MKKIFIYSLVLLFTTGCIEIMPQEVHQSIKISNNGAISTTYDGTFMDLYDLILAIEKNQNGDKNSKDLPDEKEYKKSVIDMLKKSDFNKKAYKLTSNTYYSKWQEDTNISYPNSIPKLLSSYGNDKIPKVVTLNGIKDLSGNAFHASYDEMNDLKEQNDDQEEWSKNLLKKYVANYKAKVSIEIDSNLVLKSNADTVQKLSNGMSLYEWYDIKFEDKDSRVDFVFSFDSMDKDRYKLTSAPVGTSCKSLIGTDCKCGPFSLYSYDGSPLSYRGYIIKAKNITKKDCSDEKGNVPSITSKVTGICTITMLTEKESSKLCGDKKLKH